MPKDNSSLYREVLRQAWRVVVSNKYLWILGFFASFLANVGVYDVLLRGLRGAFSRGIWSSSVIPVDALGLQAISIPLTLLDAGGPFALIIPVMLVVSIFVALLAWLSVVSQAGIMHATSKIVKGGASDLRESFRVGVHNFWPVLGINLVSKFAASLLLMGISVPVYLVLKDGGALQLALYLALFIVLVPGAMVISFLGIFSSAGVVTKKQNLFAAVKTAFMQFLKHWLVSIEMAMILLALGVAIAIGTLLLMLASSVPFVVLSVVAGLFAGSSGAGFVLIIAFTVMLAVLVVVGSFFTAYQITAWTILYLRFVERGALSKLVRLFSSLPKYLTPKRR